MCTLAARSPGGEMGTSAEIGVWRSAFAGFHRSFGTRCVYVVVVALVALAIDFAQLRSLAAPPCLLVGSVERGHFESVDGRPAMHLVASRAESSFPEPFVDANGDLAVLPGISVGVPLRSDDVLEVLDGSGRGSTPFVGWLGVDASGMTRRVMVLAVVDRHEALVEWRMDAPWAVDAERLREVGDFCGDGERPPSSVAIERGVLRAGRCAVTLPQAPQDERARLLVMGAIDGVVVRRGAGWPVTHPLQPVGWLVVPKVVLSLAAFGPATTLATSILAAAASIRAPAAAAVVWGAALLLAAAGAVLRLGFRVTARLRGRTYFRLVGVAAVVFVCGSGIAVAAKGFALVADVAREDPRQVRHRCVVTGYSTAWGDKLVDRRRAMWGELGRECSACGGDSMPVALRGGRIDWVANTFCDAADELEPGTQVVFLGGFNDDCLWGRRDLNLADSVLHIVRYVMAGAGTGEFRRMCERANAAARGALDRQTAALTRASDCIARRRARFTYVHDMVVWDLRDERSPSRSEMRETRRRVVEVAGGTFVDALAETREVAGLSWFDDFVHLSAIGHAAVGRVVCPTLGAPR